VYPGDKLISVFEISTSLNLWGINSYLVPGPLGSSEGEIKLLEPGVFEPSKYRESHIMSKQVPFIFVNDFCLQLLKDHSHKQGTYLFQHPQTNMFQAYFDVEIDNNAPWDFGPVVFENIIIVAQTTSLAWCTSK